MQLVKVVNHKRPYVSKVDGTTHPTVTYYLRADIATDAGFPPKQITLAIRPHFDKNRADWLKLDMLAKVEVVKDE